MQRVVQLADQIGGIDRTVLQFIQQGTILEDLTQAVAQQLAQRCLISLGVSGYGIQGFCPGRLDILKILRRVITGAGKHVIKQRAKDDLGSFFCRTAGFEFFGDDVFMAYGAKRGHIKQRGHSLHRSSLVIR